MPRPYSLSLLVILSFAQPVLAQQSRLPQPPASTNPVPVQPVPPKPKQLQPARDPEAVTAIQTAVAALGGEAAISQVRSWRAQGQSKAPKELRGAEGTVIWERSDAEFRMESVIAGKSNATVTGRGKPALIANGGGQELPEHVTRALFVPAMVGSLLYDSVQNADSSIRFVSRSKLGSKDVTIIRIATMQSGDSYVIERTWYLDAGSGLPLRIEYGIPSVPTLQVWYQSALDLSDYRLVEGVRYPFKIVSYLQGRELQTTTLQTIEPNATISASRFDAVVGGAK